MITKRIIPCLDVRNGRVVKGVNFAGLSDVNDPVELGRYYSACGADELAERVAMIAGTETYSGGLVWQ